MIDQLITCNKCKAETSCYTTPINETHNSYTCLNCGFHTNDLMVEGEFNFELYEAEFPELYKDIKCVDEKNRVWYPYIINIEGKGTAFVNGTSKEDWEWCGIKSIPLTEEEKESGRFKDKEYKSDSKTLKSFGKDYFDAADYIGFFDL